MEQQHGTGKLLKCKRKVQRHEGCNKRSERLDVRNNQEVKKIPKS